MDQPSAMRGRLVPLARATMITGAHKITHGIRFTKTHLLLFTATMNVRGDPLAELRASGGALQLQLVQY